MNRLNVKYIYVFFFQVSCKAGDRSFLKIILDVVNGLINVFEKKRAETRLTRTAVGSAESRGS